MSDENVSEAPIELEVEYQRLNTFFADYAKNISRGSTFIATERPLSIGTEFVFVLKVPILKNALRLNGKVMSVTRTEEASKANPAGMGIEFQYDSDTQRRQIQDRVEDLMRSELGRRLSQRLLGR